MNNKKNNEKICKRLLLLLGGILLFLFLFSEKQIRGEEAEDVLEIESPRAILMEASTGTVLYEKDADSTAHPASVTKVMTMLLIMEALDAGKITLDEEVVTSAYAKSMGGSQVFLEEGEKQTVETLLKCIVIASGNDAAVAMAEKVSGSEAAFVKRMNERAVELGMKHTNFTDCCGLTDSKEHYTTARDIALMTRELLVNYPEITRYSNVWMEDITHMTRRGTTPFTLTNTNKLLRAYEGCDGLKTGSTSLAGYCLSATAVRGGIRMISVVMTAPDSKTRFRNASELLTYGFGICTVYRDDHSGKLDPAPVLGGVLDHVEVEFEQDFVYLSVTGEDFSAITREKVMNERLRAPVQKGDVVGEEQYYFNGKLIGTSRILAAEAVKKAGWPDFVRKLWKQWEM